MPKKHVVALTQKERDFLRSVIRRGIHPSRVIVRAQILLQSDRDKTDREIGRDLECSTDRVRNARIHYCKRASIEEAISDASRSGKPPTIQPHHRAFIAATACTEPPDDHAHWTLYALKEALEEAYDDIQSISHEEVRRTLIADKLKPWRKKNVLHPDTDTAVQRAHGRHTRAVHRKTS